jgi:glutathione peroxidase-family protein
VLARINSSRRHRPRLTRCTCIQGDNDTIQSFCLKNYGVSFPILGKTDVNGDKAEPVYEWMKGSISGLLGMKRIKWNFEKFLIGKDGVCLLHFHFQYEMDDRCR